MISFRYHVVTVVAVFLALAAGVALGGGPLAELGRAAEGTSAADAARLQQARESAGYADQVLDRSSARLYADRLAKDPVAVLVFPGVPESTQEAVRTQVAEAGGMVSAVWTVEPSLVSTGEKALVDTLGSQLMTQLKRTGIEPTATTYDRMGQLLGLAMATTKQGGAATSPMTDSVRQSLAGADLVSTEGTPASRADRVVVLLGDDTGAEEDPIYAGLLAGLSRQVGSLVVAADTADGASGRLARLREDPATSSLTTVDGVDQLPGQVTTVLVLTEWPATRGHAYGASGADGAVTLR
ncbi:MAG TPA: copper transporter [Nocardioides sp.]|uniref:copper transporter n=1 Tax=Nocardioides sp. TaxID=35761 RepID=UPI002C1A3F3E|nr:copper transporter [Nocardioides sp.]HQR27278.1 copper transporter [Nocardioides sp.]